MNFLLFNCLFLFSREHPFEGILEVEEFPPFITNNNSGLKQNPS